MFIDIYINQHGEKMMPTEWIYVLCIYTPAMWWCLFYLLYPPWIDDLKSNRFGGEEIDRE